MATNTGALVRNSKSVHSDYVLKPGEDSCWITVNNISIYIYRDDEYDLVRVELYPLGCESLGNEPFDFAYASFEEAQDAIDNKHRLESGE